ncbi:hypothetical protein ACFWBB_27815 [Streptomyces sp. NPDC060000]|uniref:hypothetical protein n=1 Tax=Streptomyces sp. NPDC060000 TaxID=3347031 RepID=UPI0036CE474A
MLRILLRGERLLRLLRGERLLWLLRCVRGLLSVGRLRLRVRRLLRRVLRLLPRRELGRLSDGLVRLLGLLLVLRLGRRRGLVGRLLVRRLLSGRGLVRRGLVRLLLRRRCLIWRLLRRDGLAGRDGRPWRGDGVLGRAGLAVGMARTAVPVRVLRLARVNRMGHMSSP